MAFWSPSSITPINQGADPGNLGDGDTIRTAFTYVENNFTAISNQLGNVSQDFLNANVTTALRVGGTTTTANLAVNNITTSSTVYGNINMAANIIPVVGGQYDLGSPANPFRTIYFTSQVSGGVAQTTDAGLLVVHANAAVADVKDVGIFGNISHHYTSNTYAFFGYQYQSNSFVYKITNTDASKGNSVVYDGFYGNVQVGGILASNSTPATSNVTGAIVAVGGISTSNDIYAKGNIYTAGYRVLNTADVSNLGYPTYNGIGSLFTGNTVFATITPSTTTTTGAVVVLGGVGVVGNISAGGYLGPYYGSIANPTQTGITSVGTLNGLTVSGTTNTTSLQATSVGATSVLTTSAQTGTLIVTSSMSTPWVFAGITYGNVINAATIGNVGTVLTGTLSTAAQTNVTSLGTLTGLTVSGNTAINSTLYGRGVFDNGVRVVSTSSGAGNLAVSGTAINLTAVGPGAVTVGSASAIPTVTTDAYGRITGLTSSSATIAIAGTSGTGSVNPGGTLTFASTNGVTATASSSTITVSTSQDLRTSATPSFAGITSTNNITVTGAVVPSANVTYNLGSTTAWWNTIYGKAVQAQYADLAEKYTSDASYEAGTVLIFGGNEEVTTTIEFADTRVAGVVSTNPAYLMNSEVAGVAIALRGRVPCKVVGPVQKGDLLVTCGDRPGFAISVGRGNTYGASVFAKALEESLTDNEKVIEVVIL